MLIALVLSIVMGVSGIIVLWFELSITKDEVYFMEEKIYELNKRLTRLEKDAVKVTFNPPFTTSEDHPESHHNPQKNQIQNNLTV